MIRIGIDRLLLNLEGVGPDVARDALEGLDAELARRLAAVRVDPALHSSLPAAVRLPPIAGAVGLGPDALRGLIADALASLLLSGPAPRNPGGH